MKQPHKNGRCLHDSARFAGDNLGNHSCMGMDAENSFLHLEDRTARDFCAAVGFRWSCCDIA